MFTRSFSQAKLFLGFLFLYLFFAAGYIDTIDADPSLLLAKSLYQGKGFYLEPQDPTPVLYAPAFQRPGYVASKLGVGMALVYLPWVAVTEGVNRVLGPHPYPILEFLVSLTNAFVTAWLLVFLFSLLMKRGFSEGRALFATVLCGFGTLLLLYSKTCQREPIQALCLLGLLAFSKEAKFLKAGLFAGLGILVKSVWILPAIPLLIYALHQTKTVKNKVSFGLPILFSFGIVFYYQWKCFGHPLSSGYSASVENVMGQSWSVPFWAGLATQLFSMNEGLFVINPLLLLCVFSAVCSFRARRFGFLDLALFSACLIQLFIYARWFNPLGGWCLGPRYLITVLPCLFLLLRPEILFPRSGILRTGILVLALFSFSTQFVHASVKPQQYWVLDSLSQGTWKETHWQSNFEFFRHKLFLKEEKYEEHDLSSVRSLQGLNYWWLHLMRHTKSA